MQRRFLTILLAAGVLIGLLVILGATFVCYGRGHVLAGVKARDVELQGLSKEKGMEVLQELEKKILASPVYLKYQDDTWELPLTEVDFRLEAGAMMDDALHLGRQGSFIYQWQQRRQIKRQGYELPFRVCMNKKKFEQKISDLTAKWGYPPQEADFKITADDRVEVGPSKDGLQVDTEDAYKQLLDSLGQSKAKTEINLRLTKVKPRLATENVVAMGLKGLLSSYCTSFDSGNTGRSYNIKVAAAALDGLLVPPGKEISFNEVVGPRSSEAGYKNAKVIVNNELVDGIGGGVCQVSSTLYNALLLANLEVTERDNHSLPVSYVPLGRDATVTYGGIDMKFRNSTESHIYIRSWVQGGKITFKIYGNTDYKVPVTIRTRVVKEIEPEIVYQPDANLKKGEQVVKQEGYKGYQIATERVVEENGKPIIEQLFGSSYAAKNKIIAVGTKEESGMPLILPPGVKEDIHVIIPPAGGGASQGGTPAKEQTQSGKKGQEGEDGKNEGGAPTKEDNPPKESTPTNGNNPVNGST